MTDNCRDRKGLAVKIVVNVEHTQGLLLSLLRGFVHCMTLLPQKFRGAQERTGGFFPSYNAAPLVVELWKVAVGVDDLFVVLAEKRLGGWAHSQTLVELFLTADSYPCTFGSKALNVILLLLEQAFGDKHRHINVLVTGLLKAAVKVSLDIFPNSVAVGTDHHAALYAGIINQLCLFYDVGIPFCKILVAACDSLDHFFIVSHKNLLRNGNIIVIFLLYYI